jgi:hypothetical protein
MVNFRAGNIAEAVELLQHGKKQHGKKQKNKKDGKSYVFFASTKNI